MKSSQTHTNPEIERRLLSAVIAGGSVSAEQCITKGLTSEAFSDLENRAIWEAILHVAASSGRGPIELQSIALVRWGSSLKGHHLPSLVEISDLEPTSTRTATYCTTLLNLHVTRQVAQKVTALYEHIAAMDGEHDPAEAVAVVLREIHDVLAHTETQGTSDYFAEARRRLESPEPEAVASSGLPKWDKAGGPFLRAGELLVIGARPGMGKTILSLQAAAATATLGKCVLFVSLEMPPDQLLLRLAQSRAGEEGVIRPCMDAEDEARAKAARLAALRSVEADIGDRLQFLTCSESTTLNAIEARARLLAASRSDLSLIVIDYLQLIPPPEGLRKDTRERQVAEMSRRLKLLALNLGVPIIVLSQLNREGAQTAAPDLCNLRESGAIEQDADVVWLLYPHPDRFAYDGEESRTSTVLLTQAKARNGPAGIHYELTLQRECLKFSER